MGPTFLDIPRHVSRQTSVQLHCLRRRGSARGVAWTGLKRKGGIKFSYVFFLAHCPNQIQCVFILPKIQRPEEHAPFFFFDVVRQVRLDLWKAPASIEELTWARPVMQSTCALLSPVQDISVIFVLCSFSLSLLFTGSNCVNFCQAEFETLESRVIKKNWMTAPHCPVLRKVSKSNS